MGFTIKQRIEISIENCLQILKDLEWTQNTIHISRTIRCKRANFRGVPAKRVDVCVDEWILQGQPESDNSDPPIGIVMEIGRKTGKYSGDKRWRINIRRWMKSATPQPWGEVEIERDTKNFKIAVRPKNMPDSNWEFKSRILRNMVDYDNPPAKILMWHATRFYVRVWRAHKEEIEALANAFEPEGITLAEANREASRAIYRLARDLGWRKLTKREQQKHNLTGAWHREETIAKQKEENFGVSEHTINLAHRRGVSR